MSRNTLSPEIKHHLSVLVAQINADKVSDELQKKLKVVVSALIVENGVLKRENAQLKKN
jgi:hypothetical protein